MENTFVFAFLFLSHFSHGGTFETYCSRGERLHTPREGHDVCIPCPHGTFIAEDYHFFRECKPCTRIENPNMEVLVSACDSTRDAVILCTGGFYRRRARNGRQKDRCEKCTECPFPTRPCEGYYNTVCCPPNHDAVRTPDGVFVCNKRRIVCGVGQFFRTSSDECLPCPAGTFMSDHSHTYKNCLKCEELSENILTHAVIIRPCSRTTPTLFGCKVGSFRDPKQESLQIEVPCTPCRMCNRRLTDCDMFHDAVCDDEDRIVPTAATNLTVSIALERCGWSIGTGAIVTMLRFRRGYSLEPCRPGMPHAFADIEKMNTVCTSEDVDMIKQLNGTFNGSMHGCILDCIKGWFPTLEDSIPQLESSERECLSSCLPEIHKARIRAVWMLNSLTIGMLVLVNLLIWRIQKHVAADKCRKGYSYPKRCAYVLFVLNCIGVITLLVEALLETMVLEDKVYGTALYTYCSVVFILNTVFIGKYLTLASFSLDRR